MTSGSKTGQSENSGLATAPPHIKLAVDLIMLLEQQHISEADIVAALEIVLEDYRKKA